MRKILLGFCSVFLLVSNTWADADWGYNKNRGPTQWGNLGYTLCASGHEQSPIDIMQADTRAQSLRFHYQTANFTRKADSHNLYAYALEKDKSTLEFAGDTYQLQSLHFHTPSEHEMQGKQYPFEGHFIHQNAEGKIVVVGVFFKEGRANPALQTFLGTPKQKVIHFNVNDFLRAGNDFYQYKGSLTTPPCTQGLTWIVLKKPITLSRQQLRFFQHYIMANNSRPPQPLNGRSVSFTS